MGGNDSGGKGGEVRWKEGAGGLETGDGSREKKKDRAIDGQWSLCFVAGRSELGCSPESIPYVLKQVTEQTSKGAKQGEEKRERERVRRAAVEQADSPLTLQRLAHLQAWKRTALRVDDRPPLGRSHATPAAHRPSSH